MQSPLLLSIQVGLPKLVEPASHSGHSPWRTAFFKEPVLGPVWVGRLGLEGDDHADMKNHGGVEKAVLVYPALHYPKWRSELALGDLKFGGFAENFTVSGLNEATVCIGDLFKVGGAFIQVSQPRPPCWKLSRRWQINDLAERVQLTGRSGWYCRVFREGYVEPGQPIVLLERPFPQWTVSSINDILYGRCNDLDMAAQAAQCQYLSAEYRNFFLAQQNGR